MTTSIEHSLPPELVIADQSLFGVYRPGNVISYGDTGLRRSRSYGEHNLASYALQFNPSNYTNETYEQLMALMNATAVNALPFWIKEPISKPRIAVPGELTEAGRDTYINPLDTSSVNVLIGDEIDEGSKTHHASANILTDVQAAAAGGVTTGLQIYGSGSISAVRNPALGGLHSILVSPSSPATAGVELDGNVTVSGSQRYTVGASFFVADAADVYVVTGYFYSGATPIAYFNTSGSGAAGGWLHLRATSSSTASIDNMNLLAYRSNFSSSDFAVSCLMVSPGENERWFLPSQSPRLIEWTSDPTAGKRLTFSSGSCQRWARVATEREQQLASLEILGNVTSERMSVREVLFP